MKKVLIGLFLVANLSILGAESIGNEQNYSTSINSNYYAIDGSLMGMNLKEKAYFKEKTAKLGEEAEKTGKFDSKKYIELLKEYIKKYPDDDFAYEMIGTEYLKDNPKEAEKYFLKAVELGDTDTGLYSLAIVYNDDDVKLLNLKPDEKKAKIKLRDKYLKQLTDEGFTHESLKELRNHKLAAAISGNAYSIYRLAVYYYGTKNYKLAEKYAKEFLKFDKKNPEILNILSGASK